MKRQNDLFRNTVIRSFSDNGIAYSLEKRADSLFIIRKNDKTIALNSMESVALEKFDKLEAELRGGEKENMVANGKAKFDAVGEKLKADQAEAEAQQEKSVVEAKNQLEMVRKNSSLSKMFEEEAKKEMSDGMGSQPLLKIHTLGRSNNELMDGSQPDDGDFFYTPSQEAFKNPNIHLLVMSEGFYAEGLPDDSGKPKIGYNILLGGTIIDGEGNRTMRPFLMYITSQAIRQSIWDFRNELNKYARLMRVPKMALVVKMTHEKVPNPNPKWVKTNPKVNNIRFSIEKLEDGSPVLVTDENEFAALVDIQAMLKEMVDSIIAAKSVEKPSNGETQSNTTLNNTRDVVEGEIADDVDPAQDVQPDEIPF